MAHLTLVVSEPEPPPPPPTRPTPPTPPVHLGEFKHEGYRVFEVPWLPAEVGAVFIPRDHYADEHGPHPAFMAVSSRLPPSWQDHAIDMALDRARGRGLAA